MNETTRMCDCELGHNGLGLVIRECDCDERKVAIADRNQSTELVAPDRIDRTFIQQVLQAMSFQKSVAPNAVYQCLSWAYKRIGDMEEKLATIARDAQDCIDDQ